jgi:hypothetical protein
MQDPTTAAITASVTVSCSPVLALVSEHGPLTVMLSIALERSKCSGLAGGVHVVVVASMQVDTVPACDVRMCLLRG